MVEEIKELAGQYKKDGDRSLIDRIEAIPKRSGSCKSEGEFSWHLKV